jgi:hypothetical protein
VKCTLRPSAIGAGWARGTAALTLMMALAPAWAYLGGDLASVQADQTRMRAARLTTSAAQAASVHDIRLADGSSIRQFVNAQGIVYAVAWSTRMKPDFAQMLGRHAAEFDGLQRSVTVDRGDLVVHSAGRPGAFVGKAWLKSQLPAGTSADAIR